MIILYFLIVNVAVPTMQADPGVTAQSLAARMGRQALALGALTGGMLGSAIGLRPTLWLAVGGAVTCALWLVRSPLPALRELEPEPALPVR